MRHSQHSDTCTTNETITLQKSEIGLSIDLVPEILEMFHKKLFIHQGSFFSFPDFPVYVICEFGVVRVVVEKSEGAVRGSRQLGQLGAVLN